MRALLIMGPTASGKSALGLRLAEAADGEIVNADSMQVYADLRVLTARPSDADLAAAPHHLYGHVDAGVRHSVGAWLKEARNAIEAIRGRGKTPIVLGGTGLYFRALTEGLSTAPAAPTAELEARLATEGAPALHAALAAADGAAAARIAPNDGPRLIRALSVLEATGRTLSSFPMSPPLADWVGLALWPERGALYAAIEARFDAMIATGALDEVRALAPRGLDPGLPAMKAHGAPALMAHLRGDMRLEEAAALGKRDTRRYAKRQFTWMAHQLSGWTRAAAADLAGRAREGHALLKGAAQRQ
ncbi:MAG: tRNA (adenosine(37)-N6)-dimethylallyltransferase MiaA [Hyphomonadaceae bacterium]